MMFHPIIFHVMKLIQLLMVSLAFGAMVSCGNTANQARENISAVPTPMIGGDADRHGCLPSAGESWSELRQTCMQLFNEATRLNPVKVGKGEAVISAFIVFNDDMSKAEVFLPSDAANLILVRSNKGIYQQRNYSYDPNTGTLSKDGQAIYKTDASLK